MRRAVLRTVLAVGLALVPCVARAAGLELVGAVNVNDASAVAVSADGANVYVSSGLANAVYVFSRDASTGLLTKVQTISATLGAVGIFATKSIALSADGKNAYFMNRSPFAPYKDGVSVWTRDPGTGTLTLLEVQKDGVGGVTDLDGITSVIVSGDGLHVYARARASSTDASIVVFTRNPTTGALTFASVTSFASDAYGGENGIALSPDGAHLYAVGHDAVAVFARDSGTGALTLTSTAVNGVGGIAGLNGPRNLALSPDGASVYVAAPGQYGYSNHEVVVLARNAATGVLTYVERHNEPRPLRGPRSIAVDPSGGRVFVTAIDGDGAVGAYARNPATGALTLGVASTGTPTTNLQAPIGIAVSPDNAHVYVADGNANVVAVFDVRCGTGTVDAGEICDDGNVAPGDGCSPSCGVERCFACAGEPSVCAPADGTSCYDGNECTTNDTCMGGVCAGTPDDGASCDDRSVCTIGDTCFGGSCAGVPEPQLGCRQPIAPGTTSLALIDKGVVDMQWKWRGQQTSVADFGDPVSGATRYTACVYEQTGPLLNLEADVCPSGDPCWRTNARGATLNSRSSFIARLKLKAGPDGKAAVDLRTKVKPLPGGLPLAPPVTVQLKAWHWSNSGDQVVDTCWGASYGAPAKNDVFGFKAKND